MTASAYRSYSSAVPWHVYTIVLQLGGWGNGSEVSSPRKQELLPLSDRLHKGMDQKLLWWWISHCRELLLKKRRIGSAINELCSKWLLKMQDQCTLIEQSLSRQLSFTLQLDLSHPAHCSATFKSPNRQFNYNQDTLLNICNTWTFHYSVSCQLLSH